MFKFNLKYFLLSLLLLLIEIAIGKYAHDRIIRPYVGDLLVAVLIYCFVMGFTNYRSFYVALGSLYFCYAVEVSQHFHLVDHLGLGGSRFARMMLGTQFSWVDMLCYTFGIIGVLWLENEAFKHNHRLIVKMLCNTSSAKVQ